ncbi:MAG: cutinase family protein [Mycobacterium sp.]|nr:cutinase family protein [Mycobacterium sp.]
MITRHIARILGPAVVATSGLGTSVLTSAVPFASAQPCPDVQVVFARGTGEAPGIGPTGQAFIDNLRPRLAGKSFDVYPVNYPASDQWNTGLDGIRDAGTHVVSMAQSCPNTKMVLSGYSQGAAVMGFVTSSEVPTGIPDGIDPANIPKPLSPDVASHVSSVVLFGTPNARAMSFLGEPPLVIGPLYQAKTIKVCEPGDPVCSDGLDFAAHNTYVDDVSMIDQGAAFAASRVNGTPNVGPQPPVSVAGATGGGFGE